MPSDDWRVAVCRLELTGDLLVTGVAVAPIEHLAISSKLRNDEMPVTLEACLAVALFFMFEDGRVGSVETKLSGEPVDDIGDLLAGSSFGGRNYEVPDSVLRVRQASVGSGVLKQVLTAHKYMNLFVFFAAKYVISEALMTARGQYALGLDDHGRSDAIVSVIASRRRPRSTSAADSDAFGASTPALAACAI